LISLIVVELCPGQDFSKRGDNSKTGQNINSSRKSLVKYESPLTSVSNDNLSCFCKKTTKTKQKNVEGPLKYIKQSKH
jgi:hypothetical protein